MTTRKGEDNAIQKKEKETMPNLADRSRDLHVTRGFISNVENGRVNMSMRLMVYYAQLMHVSLDEIAGLTDKQYLSTALDNEIMEEVSQLSLEEKNDLLNHLRSNRKARKKTEESKVEPVS